MDEQGTLPQRLRQIRGTQLTPLENDLMTEAADALDTAETQRTADAARIAELEGALAPRLCRGTVDGAPCELTRGHKGQCASFVGIPRMRYDQK